MKKFFCCLFALSAVLAACTSKVYLAELTPGEDDLVFCLDGKRFTGTACSSDDVVKAEFKDGLLAEGTVYHVNGKLGIRIKLNPYTDELESVEFYDDKGTPITYEEFLNQYAGLLESWDKESQLIRQQMLLRQQEAEQK